MGNIIQIQHLKKYFQNIKAVDDISFSVEEGSLFAFLGLNGAGKSTTINIICGDYHKDSGSVKVNGLDIDKDMQKIKCLLGVVYQESVLDKKLTVKDNLICRASLYGISYKEFKQRIDELDRLLKIKELMNRTLEKLSGGQKRRVDIVRSLIHKPKILILDEPTTGLDPQTRRMVWDAINQLRKNNHITVFLTTHYMEEASDADNVVIIDKGKIVAQGTPTQLKNQYTGDYIKFYNTNPQILDNLNLEYQTIGDCLRVEVKSTSQATKLMLNNPEIFEDYEITKGKMDDVFLAVTGKQLTGDDNE